MKYLTVFLLFVLLLVNETTAQRSRTGSKRANNKTPVLSNFEFSSPVGYKKFWDKKSQGFSVYSDVDAIAYLSPTIGLGVFGYLAGGGGQFNDGYYREPSFNWSAGVKGKLRTKTSFYSIGFGYGQISRQGEIASGFKDVVFSDFVMGKVEYSAYGRRLARETWLPSAGIFLEGKIALKKETTAWSESYFISHELFPEMVKLAGDLALIDLRIKDLNISWGLNGAVNLYDYKKPKVFYEVGTFLNSSHTNNNVAKVYFAYQNGITGIKGVNRMILGGSLDISFLFKINQTNTTQTNNNRRRTR